MKEIWKDIEGYEGLYQVSNLGQVKSLQREIKKSNGQIMYVKEKLLTHRVNDRGYVEIKLSRNGKGSYLKLHRLVAKAFIPNPMNKAEVNHKNGNKLENDINNLEWMTHEENIVHSFETNLVNRRGSKNSQSIITEDKVKEIRNRKAKQEKLLEVFKGFENEISLSTFKSIWYGYSWKHVEN